MRSQLELVPLPATPDGPDLDALGRLCAPAPVRAIYAMPTLHNPLGWVMPAPAARGLVEIARQHGLLIIEDASYAFLAEQPPPPLAALAPEITVYVSGLSKSVATGLRVGFVSAPAALVPAIERAIRATTWNTPADQRPRSPAAGSTTVPSSRLEAEQARRRQRPGRRSPATLSAGLPLDRPSVVVLRVAPAARGRPRRPDSRRPRAPAHLGIHGGALRHLHAGPAGDPARAGLDRYGQSAVDAAYSAASRRRGRLHLKIYGWNWTICW